MHFHGLGSIIPHCICCILRAPSYRFSPTLLSPNQLVPPETALMLRKLLPSLFPQSQRKNNDPQRKDIQLLVSRLWFQNCSWRERFGPPSKNPHGRWRESVDYVVRTISISGQLKTGHSHPVFSRVGHCSAPCGLLSRTQQYSSLCLAHAR